VKLYKSVHLGVKDFPRSLNEESGRAYLDSSI